MKIKYLVHDEMKGYTLHQASESEVIEKVKSGEIEIINVVDPTEPILQLFLAEDSRPSLLQYTHTVPYETFKKAIKRYPYIIQFYDDLDERLLSIAVRENPNVIKIITNPTEKLCVMAVKADPMLLEHCNVDKNTMEDAILSNPNAIRVCRDFSVKLAKLAVRKDPIALFHIIKRCEFKSLNADDQMEIYTTAVQLDPFMIRVCPEEVQNALAYDTFQRECRIVNLLKNAKLREELLATLPVV